MGIISWDEFVKQKQGEYELTIEPSELKLGDYVARIDTGGKLLSFPETGQSVETFAQKQWFQQHCHRVIIDVQRSLNRRAVDQHGRVSDAGSLPAISGNLDRLRSQKLSPQGLIDTWQVYRLLSHSAQALILSFHRHGQIDVEGTRHAIEELREILSENMAAVLWLARIKEQSRYTFQHGLNVALYGAAFAKAAGWDDHVVETVAMAGLLHDLGKTRIDLKVLNKPEPLSPAERDHVRLHCRLAYDLLSQNRGVTPAEARAVLSHHERPDGKGYPDGLTREGIPDLARLIGVLDAYDAMTSPRFHRPAMSHQQAMGEIWKLRGQQFDSDLAEAFSRFLGWAPPGTLIRLPGGQLAVALHAADGHPRPVVCHLHKRGEGFAFGVEAQPQQYRDSEDSGGGYGSLLPDGFGGVSLRDLTRQLPKTLSLGTGSDAVPTPRRERRQRPRVDAPRGSRMLVVDDSMTIRKTLENMLGQSGYRVDLAEDGQTALDLAEQERPDLIFLDIVLPDISGFRALRRLRRNPVTRNIPVIMISGNSGAIEKFFLQRVGADDFIHKPFGRFEVFSAIERLIRSGALPRRVVN
jgi:response regulator RpfG family c-di-GMP phosphodiesterase